jgi:predicted nucleotidyltransferase
MNPRENILERLRTIKPALQQEFPLRRMALFGSWARNEQTDTSDVDILVEVDPSMIVQDEREIMSEAAKTTLRARH